MLIHPSIVKLKLKSAVDNEKEHEILLDKNWLRMNIPHIENVIKDVKAIKKIIKKSFFIQYIIV